MAEEPIHGLLKDAQLSISLFNIFSLFDDVHDGMHRGTYTNCISHGYNEDLGLAFRVGNRVGSVAGLTAYH